MRGAPSSEAVGIQGLLEVPLVVVQHAQAPGLAPELPNEERQHHEGGQTDRAIENVQETKAARRLWPESDRPSQKCSALFAARSCS